MHCSDDSKGLIKMHFQFFLFFFFSFYLLDGDSQQRRLKRMSNRNCNSNTSSCCEVERNETKKITDSRRHNGEISIFHTNILLATFFVAITYRCSKQASNRLASQPGS